MGSHRIRVLLVDDHEIVRKGIRALLETEPTLEVVGEAGDGHEAVAAAERLKPDVVLMDLVMPKLDGVSATREITTRCPATHVLVLTSYGSDNQIFPAVKAGALGFLLKDTDPAKLVVAIRAAAAGQSALDPVVARRLLREFSHEGGDAAPSEPLSERELDVLKWVARGLPNEEIGARLFISEATVRTHVSSILGKLNLANRTQAALYALREGIASLDEIGRDEE